MDLFIFLLSHLAQVSETEINGQFESVCESVFSEMESQAMDALDLPGCFRTRSHSYLRAIQAGYSQDDDCIQPMTSTVTSTIRSTTGKDDCNYILFMFYLHSLFLIRALQCVPSWVLVCYFFLCLYLCSN